MRIWTDIRCLPPRGVQIDASGSSGVGVRALLRKSVRKTVAQFAVGSGLTVAQSVTFQAHNPSPRLRWMLSIGWELNNNADFSAGAGSPTWRVRVLRLSPEAPSAALLNDVFTSPGPTRALPDAYEMDSAVKDVRGTVALNPTDLAAGLAGSVVLEGTWEPNGPPDDETLRLLQEADLQVVGTPPTIQNTT